jgi:hypothetical protein
VTSGTVCSRTSQAEMPDGLVIFSILTAAVAGAAAKSASDKNAIDAKNRFMNASPPARSHL